MDLYSKALEIVRDLVDYTYEFAGSQPNRPKASTLIWNLHNLPKDSYNLSADLHHEVISIIMKTCN